MKKGLIEEIRELNKYIIKQMFQSNNLQSKHPRPLQVAIMEYLDRNANKTITQKDLQKEFRISKAAISDVMKAMERNHLIRRSTSDIDARKNNIELTDEAKKDIKKILENKHNLNQLLINSITEEEYNEFIRISNKIKKNMEEINND